MMFLQYFIWSMWYVTLGTYMMSNLDASAIDVGSAYATFSISAMISPILIGILADRLFSSKILMTALHLTGATLLLLIADIQSIRLFWWIILAYTFLYTPTISLSNAVVFNQVNHAGKEFPMIRVWGTIGWIAAGITIGFLKLEQSNLIFKIAAAASVLLSLISLTLPTTSAPKESNSWKSNIGLQALTLFKDKSYLIFFIISILMCIPLTFYYSFANPFLNDIGLSNATGKMTLGQVSEAAFMILIPLLFVKWGVKRMLAVALICWIARYLFFAFGNSDTHAWMLITGIILHGACYDFFFVTGQIYTESKASSSMKNAAQGLITFATYGVGMFFGSFISGYLTELFRNKEGASLSYDWTSVWFVPAAISTSLLLLLILLFKEKIKISSHEPKTSN